MAAQGLCPYELANRSPSPVSDISTETDLGAIENTTLYATCLVREDT